MEGPITGNITIRLGMRLQKLLTADAFNGSRDKIDIIKELLRKHYESMPEAQVAKLLGLYERMTPEERKRPGKA